MNEPVSYATAAGGVASYAAGQAIGTFLGAAPEAFALGLVGAFAVCAWQESFDQPRKTYAGIFLAMLVAGYGSPAAVATISHYFPFLSADLLLYAMPLAIGVLVPVIGPSGIRWLKGKVGGDK